MQDGVATSFRIGETRLIAIIRAYANLLQGCLYLV